MRPIRKLPILPVACVTLSLVGVGCDNSTTNESQSPDAAGATAISTKEAPAPPRSMKEFYERTQATSKKKKEAPAAAKAKTPPPAEKATDKEKEKSE